jgi:hypothetical protein
MRRVSMFMPLAATWAADTIELMKFDPTYLHRLCIRKQDSLVVHLHLGRQKIFCRIPEAYSVRDEDSALEFRAINAEFLASARGLCR